MSLFSYLHFFTTKIKLEYSLVLCAFTLLIIPLRTPLRIFAMLSLPFDKYFSLRMLTYIASSRIGTILVTRKLFFVSRRSMLFCEKCHRCRGTSYPAQYD